MLVQTYTIALFQAGLPAAPLLDRLGCEVVDLDLSSFQYLAL